MHPVIDFVFLYLSFFICLCPSLCWSQSLGRASSDCQLRQNFWDGCCPPDTARGRGPAPTRPPTLSALSNAQGFHLRPAFPLPLIMMEARLTISKKDGQWQLSFRSSMKSKLNGRNPSTSTTQRPETSNQALHTFHLGLFNPPPKMDLIFCFKSKS